MKEEFLEGTPAQHQNKPNNLKRKAAQLQPQKDLSGLTAEEIRVLEKKRKKHLKQKEKKKQKLKENKLNLFVYIKGLPEDVTEEEIDAYFQKAGMIKLDF
jgi:RNA recognition motif-containing protein